MEIRRKRFEGLIPAMRKILSKGFLWVVAVALFAGITWVFFKFGHYLISIAGKVTGSGIIIWLADIKVVAPSFVTLTILTIVLLIIIKRRARTFVARLVAMAQLLATATMSLEVLAVWLVFSKDAAGGPYPVITFLAMLAGFYGLFTMSKCNLKENIMVNNTAI